MGIRCDGLPLPSALSLVPLIMVRTSLTYAGSTKARTRSPPALKQLCWARPGASLLHPSPRQMPAQLAQEAPALGKRPLDRLHLVAGGLHPCTSVLRAIPGLGHSCTQIAVAVPSSGDSPDTRLVFSQN